MQANKPKNNNDVNVRRRRWWLRIAAVVGILALVYGVVLVYLAYERVLQFPDVEKLNIDCDALREDHDWQARYISDDEIVDNQGNVFSLHDFQSGRYFPEAIHGIDFRGADLSNIDLIYDLSMVITRRPLIMCPNFSGVDLQNADLSGARFPGADFTDANLTNANLNSTRFHEAIFQGANLEYAQIAQSDLRYADLRTAKLRDANLYGTNLSYADLEGANMWNVDLRFADLFGAYVKDGAFSDPVLSMAGILQSILGYSKD